MKSHRKVFLISLAELVVAGILAIIYDLVLKQPAVAWIVGGISILLVFSNFQILNVIGTRITEISELHKLVEDINDPDLIMRARTLINDCRSGLLALKEGLVYLDMDKLMEEATRLLKDMKKGSHIFAIHMSDHGLDRAKIWINDPRFTNFINEQKKAIKHGVVIDRIFILPRSAINNLEVIKDLLEINIYV